MKHAAARRVPEFVYASLVAGLALAIGFAIWGAATLASGVIQNQLLKKRLPEYRKQIAELTTGIAGTQDKTVLFWDYMERGNLYIATGEIARAIPDFEAARAAAATRGQRTQVLLRLAHANEARGDDGAALTCLDEAIKGGRSADTAGYEMRAALLGRLHRYDAALADLGAALALDPGSYGYRFDRTWTLVRAGRLGEAAAGLRSLVHMMITEREARGLAEASDAASGKGDFAEAIAKQTALIALRPDHFRYRLVRSDLYLWTKQPDKAFADIEAALTLNPISTEPRRALGIAYDYIHQPEKSLPELDAAIARDPDDGTLRRDRGLTLYRLDRAKDAARELTEAVGLDRDAYSMIWLHLAGLRAGAPDLKALKQNMAILAQDSGEGSPPAWPYPVMRFLAGEIPEKALLGAAEQTDTDETRRGQRCEALFYAGLAAKLRGQESHGTGLLQDAQSLCHPGFIEFIAADWELRRRS